MLRKRRPDNRNNLQWVDHLPKDDAGLAMKQDDAGSAWVKQEHFLALAWVMERHWELSWALW